MDARQLQYSPGATPLDPDEAQGLIPTHITTQGELNEWEQSNILQGQTRALRRTRDNLLSEAFVRELHRRMLGQTWTWAGTHAEHAAAVDAHAGVRS